MQTGSAVPALCLVYPPSRAAALAAHHRDSDYYYRIPLTKNASPSPHSQLHFFRGVDATFLMFDVNQPATLYILTR
jgi:hypothetical protein